MCSGRRSRRKPPPSWYIVFLLCLWDVESMILVVPPGGETLALRVFNLLHYGHNAQVNALCLTLLALAVAPLLVWKAWCVAAWRGFASSAQHATRAHCSWPLALSLLVAGCTPSAPSNQAPLAKPALQPRADHRLARRRRGPAQQAALGGRGRAGQPLRGGYDGPRAEVLARTASSCFPGRCPRPTWANPRACAATATATSSSWSRITSG